jgi:hypothetical protein
MGTSDIQATVYFKAIATPISPLMVAIRRRFPTTTALIGAAGECDPSPNQPGCNAPQQHADCPAG